MKGLLSRIEIADELLIDGLTEHKNLLDAFGLWQSRVFQAPNFKVIRHILKLIAYYHQ